MTPHARKAEAIFKKMEVSLKWSATPNQVANLMLRLAARENFDLLTTTELGKQAGKKVKLTRKYLGPEYGVRRSGETMAVWKKSVLDFDRSERVRLTKNWRWPKSWRDTYAEVFFFTHWMTQLRIRVEQAHLPAKVQQGDAYNNSQHPDVRRAVKTHKDALQAWGERLAVRLPTTRIFASADFNVDFKRSHWRREVRQTIGKLAKLTLGWDEFRGKQGSHGSRLIDGTLTNCEIKAAYVSSAWEPAVFDHEQVVTIVDLYSLVY